MEHFAFDLVDEDQNSLNKPLVVSAPSEVAGMSEATGLHSSGYVPLPCDLPAEWEHNPFRADLFTCLAEEEDDEEVEFFDDEDELDEDEEIDEDEDLDDEDLDDEDLGEDYDDEDLDEDDADL